MNRSESQSSALVVHGSRALSLPKPSRRYEGDRYCSHPGCTTRLSTYNAYETCYNHTFPWSARKTASARRPRRRPAAEPVTAAAAEAAASLAGTEPTPMPADATAEPSRIAS